MQREQAIVREIVSMISIVACCHGAKLYAHVAQDFRSQHYHITVGAQGQVKWVKVA